MSKVFLLTIQIILTTQVNQREGGKQLLDELDAVTLQDAYNGRDISFSVLLFCNPSITCLCPALASVFPVPLPHYSTMRMRSCRTQKDWGDLLID